MISGAEEVEEVPGTMTVAVGVTGGVTGTGGCFGCCYCYMVGLA